MTKDSGEPCRTAAGHCSSHAVADHAHRLAWRETLLHSVQLMAQDCTLAQMGRERHQLRAQD